MNLKTLTKTHSFNKLLFHREEKQKTNKMYENYALLTPHDKHGAYGVKGASMLSKMIKLPDQLPFDYMHLVYSGHGKWLLNQ